ncbi:MAG: DUF1192 domain-containing protein [Oceanicaulis sp.]
MFEGDEPRNTGAAITPGEDLSVLGLEQLAERKRVLEHEIDRIEAMMQEKKAGLASAESFFKKP